MMLLWTNADSVREIVRARMPSSLYSAMLSGTAANPHFCTGGATANSSCSCCDVHMTPENHCVRRLSQSAAHKLVSPSSHTPCQPCAVEPLAPHGCSVPNPSNLRWPLHSQPRRPLRFQPRRFQRQPITSSASPAFRASLLPARVHL